MGPIQYFSCLQTKLQNYFTLKNNIPVEPRSNNLNVHQVSTHFSFLYGPATSRHEYKIQISDCQYLQIQNIIGHIF